MKDQKTRQDKIKFIKELMAKFTSHIIDDIEEGLHDGSQDHFDAIEKSLEWFIEDEHELDAIGDL